MLTRPSRTASPAALASVSTLTHHCRDSRGSSVVLQREQWPTEWTYGRFSATIRPSARSAATIAERASKRSRPWKGPWTVMTPRSSRTSIDSQVVALADGEVVRVVGRGDLDGAGAELGVDVRVGDDRDRAVGQRQLDLLADEVRVPLVVGVDGDGGVTEHRLGAGGGDDEGLVALAVLDGDELAVVVLVVDLDVGDGGQTARAPVDDALGAVDQARRRTSS